MSIAASTLAFFYVDATSQLTDASAELAALRNYEKMSILINYLLSILWPFRIWASLVETLFAILENKSSPVIDNKFAGRVFVQRLSAEIQPSMKFV